MSESDIVRRKADHLELCATGPVGFRGKGTLLDDVELIHDSLPELAWDELDTSVTVLGKTLAAPLFIASMSGGTPEAAALNRALASAAERHRIGMALGSQRALLVPGRFTDGFFVREQAPTALLLGNLGAVQAAQLSPAEVMDRVVGPTGVDALCVHLNPAQELIQPGGDRDFRGCLEGLRRLCADLPVPVVAKETGCGISRAVGNRLIDAGVQWVDVSGAGGTSWVGVEALRASGQAVELGELFWDWGIPTAASLCQLSGLPLGCIATGGISDGLGVARALVLGAQAVGVARALLQAWHEGGEAAVDARLDALVAGLKVAMLLTGSRNIEALRRQPWLPGPRLARWVVPGTPLAARLVSASI